MLPSRKRACGCIWGGAEGLGGSWESSLKPSWQTCHSSENSKDVSQRFKSISVNPINFQNDLRASSTYDPILITSAASDPIFYSAHPPGRASVTPSVDAFRVGVLGLRAEVLHTRLTSVDFIPIKCGCLNRESKSRDCKHRKPLVCAPWSESGFRWVKLEALPES